MTAPPKSTLPKYVRIVLIGSVTLNLLLIGLFAGIVGSGRLPGGPPRGFDLSLGPITNALRPEDREAIGDALRARGPVVSRDDRMAAYRELVDVLGRDPFDRPAAEALLDAQADRSADVREVAQAALLDRLSAMTVRDREAFLERLGQRDH